MILVRLRGGLGNQFFQYATARALALRRSTAVRLDCSYYEIKKKRHYELDQFHVEASVCSPLELTLRRVAGRISPRLSATVWRERGQGFAPELLTLSKPLTLEGYFQTERYFADQRETLVRDLSPRYPLSAGHEALARELAGESSVCVHVRRGDYASSASNRAQFGALTPAFYATAAQRLRDEVSRPRFFVFSDDEVWTSRHVLPALGGSAQIAAPGASHLDHLALMRRCRHFLLGNSTFSWWAAWLAETPASRIVAPWPWWKREEQAPADIVPERWIRVGSQFE